MSTDSIAFINTRLQPGERPFTVESRFNGLPIQGKPLKRLLSSWSVATGLKPGVNGIVLITSTFILLAVRVHAQDTNSTPMTATNVPVIGALQATNYYDQEVVVTGKVAQVSVRSDITFINLDKRYPESPFAIVILKGRSSFSGDATALRGTSIEVKGKVVKYHDKPEMQLNSVDQLTVDGVTNLPSFLQPKADSSVTNAPPAAMQPDR